jgi:hypothetical protein
MRRGMLFGVVGPSIACILAIAAISAHAPPGATFFNGTPEAFFGGILGGYGIALLPLVPAGLVDHILCRFRWRMAAAGLTAFGITVWLAYSIADDWTRDGFHRLAFLLGLAAGLPAALCSWLAGRAARPEA